jgi:hypothetical protein
MWTRSKEKTMNSETSDIEVKVGLEIDKRTLTPDVPLSVMIEMRTDGGKMHATVRGYGFQESDEGARTLAETLDLVAQGIQTSLPDEPEEDPMEDAVRLLMESGLSEDMARGAALKTLEMFKLIPTQEPMHPQDPEYWAHFKGAGISSDEELKVQRETHDIHTFETPQHLRDARAARKKARGFKPTPVVRKDKD